MAQVKIIRRLSEYRRDDPQAGISARPARPAQDALVSRPASASGTLLPAFYAAGTAPSLEREILRDFRVLVAEFIPPAFVIRTSPG